MNVLIPYDLRDQHVFVAGGTRQGKSTVLENMILQDIENGGGVGVIDPKGDLVSDLLKKIPAHRVKDCISLDTETPISLDFMSCKPGEEEMVMNSLKFILTKGMSLDNAPFVSNNIEETIYTLLDANQHSDIPANRRATFLDIAYFLKNEEIYPGEGGRKNYLLPFVTNPRLRNRWKTNPPDPKDIERIYGRVAPFINSSILNAVFGDPDPQLRINEIMNSRKILLFNLPIESESALLYGSLVVAKFRQAAFMRRPIPKHERIPFFLYVDEFQNFQTNSFDKILSMAGGFKLCLTLANQYLYQIKDTLPAILGNVTSYVLFNMDEQDARRFAGKIVPHTPQCIVDLKPHQALYRIGHQARVVERTRESWPVLDENLPDIIKANSLRDYGRRPAESSMIRIVDNPSCDTPEMTHSKENVPDDHSEPPTLPADKSKKRNSRRAGKA